MDGSVVDGVWKPWDRAFTSGTQSSGVRVHLECGVPLECGVYYQCNHVCVLQDARPPCSVVAYCDFCLTCMHCLMCMHYCNNDATTLYIHNHMIIHVQHST